MIRIIVSLQVKLLTNSNCLIANQTQWFTFPFYEKICNFPFRLKNSALTINFTFLWHYSKVVTIMKLDTTIMDITRARHKQMHKTCNHFFVVELKSFPDRIALTQLTHAAPTHSFYIGKEGSSLESKSVEDSILNRVLPLVAKRWRYCLSLSLV